MVEMRGVEPLSENRSISFSPGGDCLLCFLFRARTDALPPSIPFMHDGFKGEPAVHVHHCRYARHRAVMLTVRTTPLAGDWRSEDRAAFRQRRAPFRRRIRFLFSRLNFVCGLFESFRELCPLTVLHDPRRNHYTPVFQYSLFSLSISRRACFFASASRLS